MKLRSLDELAVIKAATPSELSDKLVAIRSWIDRDEAPAGIQSNWTTEPANDNRVPSGMSVECAHEITPSIEAIERLMKDIDLIWMREPRRLDGKGKQELHAWPVQWDIERDQFGDVTRQHVGSLVFDGSNALLGHRDRATREKGGAAQTIPNSHVAAYVGAEDITFIPGAKLKRKGISMNKAEARAYLREMGVDGEVDLPEACVNAGVGIYAKPSRPALPAGSPVVGNIFLGQVKAPPKKGEVQIWQDLYGGIYGREDWKAAHAELLEADRTTLHALETAKTMADIGKAHGYSGAFATKQGRKALIAANDNLGAALKKAAG